MPPQKFLIMKIKVIKVDGSFTVEEKPDYWKGGSAMVSVECDNHGYDEVLLKKEAESYLNQQALTQGMRVEEILGHQATTPVSVKRGESARVRHLEFPIEILPK